MLSFEFFIALHTAENRIKSDHLFSVIFLGDYGIFIGNPGFSDSITEVHDAPKSSGSSSTASGQPQCSCARCPSRMSTIDRDKHLISIRCLGYVCSVDLRCEECES